MEDQRVRLTKKLLKEALVEILKTKPIQKVSIKEICEKANINRTTFYKHYSDEYTLLSEVRDEYVASIVESFYKPGEEKTLVNYLSMLKSSGATGKAILSNANSMSTPKQMFNKKLLESVGDPLLFKTQNMSAEEYELIATFIAFGAFAIIGNWANNNYSSTPEQVAKLVRDLVQRIYKA